MAPHLLVIGGGLAGATSALAARSRGAEVTLVAGQPGAMAGWSGRLDVFGPWADPRAESPLSVEPTLTLSPRVEARTARRARFDALRRRRPEHPYARLNLDMETLSATLEAALEAIGGGGDVPLQLTAPRLLATAAGTVTVGDGGAASCLADLSLRDAPLVWLDIHGAAPYPPALLTGLLADQLQRPAGDITSVEVETDAASPARLTHRFSQGPDSAWGQAFVERLLKALSGAPADALLLCPPVLGQSFSLALAWQRALASRAGRPVAEALAVGEPVFGLRLWRWLYEAMAARGVKRHGGRALKVDFGRSGQALTSCTLELPTGARKIDAIDAVVLATGRFASGGVRAQAPLREALLGLPLFDGSRPISDEVDPVSIAPARPWRDSLLTTLGVGIDARCRPLDDGGAPWASNLFAAGRLIGGTHPSLDGSSQGVDLVTGFRAQEALWG